MAEYGFDTLEAAEALAAAGMAEAHAKAIATTMRKAVTQGVATGADVRRVEDRMATVEENMATKADLRHVEDRMTSLEDRVATVEENMATKADLRRVEDRMTSLEGRVAAVEENMVTKADLRRLEDGIEVRVDTKLARLETRLVLTVFGAAGLLFAALKLFPAGAP